MFLLLPPSYAEIYNPGSIKEIKDMVGEIFEKETHKNSYSYFLLNNLF